MKIQVIGDGRRFTIPLPNGLILNGLTVKIARHYIQKHTEIDVTEAQLKVLCRQLKEAKKILANSPLIYVKSKAGEMVKITL